MAMRIKARIEPYMTRMVRILRVMTRGEYGRAHRKRHRITRIRHRIVGFWPKFDPNHSRIKNKIYFPEGIYGCAGAVFGLFICILLYIGMAIRMDSESNSGHSGQISALFVLFGSIWLDDSGRSFLNNTTNPASV